MKSHQSTPMFFDASPKIFEFAKKNRAQPTEAENTLWDSLKGNQLKGYRFRRQHPIGTYILDFYCHKVNLGIELDGGYHDLEKQKNYDEHRQFDIENNGKIKILRFKNEEVLENIDFVLTRIMLELESVEL